MPVKIIASPELDVLLAGDMGVSCDTGLRVRGEAAAAYAAGYRVGILHLQMPGKPLPVSPEIEACIRDFDIPILDPQSAAAAKLLILHNPRNLHEALKQIGHIQAKRIVVVTDGVDNLFCAPPSEVRTPRSISLAPTNGWARTFLPDEPGFKIEREDWPTLICSHAKASRAVEGRGLKVGVIVPADWPGFADHLSVITPSDGSVEIVLWKARATKNCILKTPPGWTVLDGRETSVDWFLNKIDALLLLDKPNEAARPEAVIAAALSAGKLVVLPPALIGHYHDAAFYAEEGRGIQTLLDLGSDSAALEKARGRSKAYVSKHFSGTKYLKRLKKLIGPPPAKQPRHSKSTTRSGPPRVLFLPKGGVGLGHVARTIATARRSGDRYQPVFVTLAESAGMIESFGYRAEYIPSASYAGVLASDWDPWFQAEIEGLIDAYEAEAIVFDGSDPPEALIRAAASRSRCKLAWIRRGMWGPGYDPSLERSKAFDLIIEPGEIAAARDRGATVHRRHEAFHVAPITVLDKVELLSRDQAAEAIGFDPRKPAVLLQLGSGENRDILSTLDTLITELKRYPELQIAIGEWANSPGTLQLWRGVKVLKGAPLSFYYNAFDFSIAASGYNTFHEAISFQLPSIFMPNTAPGMDDQLARARFAQDAGAAIELPQSDIAELPAILTLMMQQNFRAVMRQNCENLCFGNGAEAASDVISQLLTGQRTYAQ